MAKKNEKVEETNPQSQTQQPAAPAGEPAKTSDETVAELREQVRKLQTLNALQERRIKELSHQIGRYASAQLVLVEQLAEVKRTSQNA